MALVDLTLALGYVKQDAGVEDDVIQILLDGATQSVLDYVNRDVYETQNELDAAVSAGTAGAFAMVVNPAIQVAILKTLAELYTNRENSVDGRVAELPFGIRSLLSPHRIIPGL